LSGLIRDGADGNPLALVRVTIDLATTVAITDANGRYEVPVLRSAGYPSVLVSFSRSGFASGEFGYVNVTTRTSVDWILPRACAPGFGPTPQVLVQSDSIEFSWSLRTPSGQLRYPGVTDFLLEVGRYREGTSGNFTSPDLLSVTTGGTGFYKWHTPGMAAGEYWARLRLKNDCGIGRYSPPASFTWH
jgi:hypothetical protein